MKTSTLTTSPQMSKALAFLLAGHAAIPRTTGDRIRVNALDSMMSAAIDTHMQFDVDDGKRLVDARLAYRSNAGNFDPFGYYDDAAQSGGTYARMWEHHHNVQPFIAPEVWAADGRCLRRNRVVTGVALVLPESASDANAAGKVERTPAGALWWCTSIDFDADRVVFCRYIGEPMREPRRNYRRGRVAKRLVVSRAEWAAFAASIVCGSRPSSEVAAA